MKRIMLAMHMYDDANKTFPPAFKADKESKPLLSWRVLILPDDGVWGFVQGVSSGRGLGQ